nr:coatomer subunit gamma [Quercus suber]
MQAEVSSWTPGEQPLKGMVFATKLAVRHALTCPCDLLQRRQCLEDRKMQGPPHMRQNSNAHDGRMIDLAFLAYVLERYIREDLAYKIKNLRHVALADLKYEVSHYKVDPTTGETEDDGVEDEYQLEDLEVVAADYMLKVGISNFRNAWESMGDDYKLIMLFTNIIPSSIDGLKYFATNDFYIFINLKLVVPTLKLFVANLQLLKWWLL